MTIQIPLEYHGRYDRPALITVEVCENTLYLTFGPEEEGEERVDRTLNQDEALALAAALQHYATRLA